MTDELFRIVIQHDVSSLRFRHSDGMTSAIMRPIPHRPGHITPDFQRKRESMLISLASAVLHDLTYPAHQWQLLAEADHYGAPSAIRTAFWHLPQRQYNNFYEIRAALLSQVAIR